MPGLRRPPSGPATLEAVRDDIARLCRLVELLDRSVGAVIERLKIGDSEYPRPQTDWRLDGPLQGAPTLRKLRDALNVSVSRLDGAEYDIRAIRSKLDQLLDGTYTRDEFTAYLGTDGKSRKDR